MLVSIVTVSYKSQNTIRRTIESVLNQTYGHIEYWIIDGLSSDRTVDIAREYETAFKAKGYQYHIVSEKDQGIYDAMNKGIAHCTGQIVGMINSDDWYENDAVWKAVDFWKKTKYDLMYADLRIIKQSGNMIKKAKIRRFKTTRDWNHPTMFVRKEVYDKYQYENKALYDDYDLFLKVNAAGYKVCVLNEILANFTFGGASNQKDLKKMIARIKMRYRNYRKNGYSRFYIFECILMEVVKFALS